MAKTLLITRPEHDCATRYLSKWSEEIIQKGKKKGICVIDLNRDKANRARVVGTLKKTNPKLIVLNGHGSEDSVKGHNDEVVLKADDKKAITNGAKAYLGYNKDFIFTYSINKISKPLEDKEAALFLEPSNRIPLSLLKNHTAGEANEQSKALFMKNIEKLLVEGPSSEHYSAIRYLYWDMINQVCLGDKKAVFA